MKWLLASLLFFVVPQVVFGADPGGLVSCGGAECTFCDFITTTGRVINWLFKILAVIAVLALVYAGFGLVTSAGNPGALEKAKGIFSNVIIGFIIIISAWLIVDTIMKALVDQEEFGVWNEFTPNCGGVKESTSDETVLYCYANQDGNITNVRGLNTCQGYRQQAMDSGQTVGACYVCSDGEPQGGYTTGGSFGGGGFTTGQTF